MKIKKVEEKCYCIACDENYAIVEIGHNGNFRPFWIFEGEITLCAKCFNELKQLINNFKMEEN